MPNNNIKQGDDRVRPTMSILTAAQVMPDKSNHRMLVKEGKSAKFMPSTKLWSKSKTSNKITSHGEGLVETEYSLRNKYCSVRASDKVWWVVALSHVQLAKLDGYFKMKEGAIQVTTFYLGAKLKKTVLPMAWLHGA
jgi:hypothetical protein